MMKNITKIILIGICFLFVSGCVFYSTKPNEIGVRTKKFSLFGQSGIEQEIYAPGSTYIFLPFINDWHTYNTNIQNMEMTAQISKGDLIGQDDIKFKTIDGNDIGLDLIISYRIIPEKAPLVLATVAKSDLELRTKIIQKLRLSPWVTSPLTRA